MINLISLLILTILAVALSRVRYVSSSNLRMIRKCLSGDCVHSYIPEMEPVYEARQDLEKALLVAVKK